MITLKEIYQFLWDNKIDQLASHLEEGIKLIEDQQLQIQYILFQNRIERFKGNYKTSLRIMEQINYDEINNDELKALYIVELGSTYFREGETSKATQIMSKFDELRISAQSEFGRLLMVEYLDLKAKFLINSQDFISAEPVLEQVNRLLRNIDHPIVQSSVYNASGIIAFFRGNLEKANDLYMEALKIYLALGDQRGAGVCYSNIGYNYYVMGNPDASIQNLQEAEEILEKLGIDYYKATVYFNQIRTLLYIDQLKDAKTIFKTLEELWNKTENRGNERIESVYKLSKAQLLLRGSRLRDKIKAQELFKEIIDEDLETQFVIIAMVHLAEILLLELRISEDEEIINEIDQIAAKLNRLSIENDSHILKIHSVLVKAKIETIRGNYVEAYDSFKRAEQIAKAHGIQLLHKQIMEDLEEMKKNVLHMKDVLDQNSSITQRIEHSEFENYLNSLKNLV